MMNCRQFKDEIQDSVALALESQAARAHAAACPLCAGWHTEQAGVRRLTAALGRVAAPPDFDFRLRARLAAGRPVRRLARWVWPLRVLAGTAAAALVLGLWLGAAREPARPAGPLAQTSAWPGELPAPPPQTTAPVQRGVSSPEMAASGKPGVPATVAAVTPFKSAGSRSLLRAERIRAVPDTRSRSLEERSKRVASVAGNNNVSIEIPKTTTQVKVFLQNPQGHRRTLSNGVLIVGRQGLPAGGSGVPVLATAGQVMW